MKPVKLLFLCFVVIVAALLIWVKVTYRDPANIKNVPPVVKSNTERISKEGTVTVKVIPSPLLDTVDKKNWAFNVTLDAHTGSLDDDLTQTALLQNDKGESVRPKTWEGSPLGGHHREGTLIFEPFSQEPKSVTLILRSVGGVPERKFIWEVKE